MNIEKILVLLQLGAKFDEASIKENPTWKTTEKLVRGTPENRMEAIKLGALLFALSRQQEPFSIYVMLEVVISSLRKLSIPIYSELAIKKLDDCKFLLKKLDTSKKIKRRLKELLAYHEALIATSLGFFRRAAKAHQIIFKGTDSQWSRVLAKYWISLEMLNHTVTTGDSKKISIYYSKYNKIAYELISFTMQPQHDNYHNNYEKTRWRGNVLCHLIKYAFLINDIYPQDDDLSRIEELSKNKNLGGAFDEALVVISALYYLGKKEYNLLDLLELDYNVNAEWVTFIYYIKLLAAHRKFNLKEMEEYSQRLKKLFDERTGGRLIKYFYDKDYKA